MKKIMVVLFIIAFFGTASAQTRELIASYLAPIIQKAANTSDNFEWDQSDQGGYVFMFKFDVLGTGTPCVFLSTSMEMEITAGKWTVFYPNGSSDYLSFNNEVYAQSVPLMIAPAGQTGHVDIYDWIAPQRHADPSLSSTEARTQYEFTRYHFVPPSIEETRQYVARDDVDAFKTQHRITEENVKVVALLISDFIENPSASWTPIVPNRGDQGESNFMAMEGFLHLKSDKEHPKSRQYFTPAYALQMLKKIAHGEKGLFAPPSVNPNLSSSTLPKPQPQTTVTTQPTEPSSSRWYWLAGLLGVAVAGVAITYFLKTRPAQK